MYTSSQSIALCVYFSVGVFYNTQTVSPPDWSQSFTFGVCSLLTLPIVLPSHRNCVHVGERTLMCLHAFVCAHLPVYVQHVHVCRCCVFVVFPYVCACVCVRDHWTVTSLAYGMMAVITTFQRAPIGSIKMS